MCEILIDFNRLCSPKIFENVSFCGLPTAGMQVSCVATMSDVHLRLHEFQKSECWKLQAEEVWQPFAACQNQLGNERNF